MKVSEWLTMKASLWTDRLDCLCFRRLLFVQTSQFTFLFLSTIFRVYKPYLKFSDELYCSNVDGGGLTRSVVERDMLTCPVCKQWLLTIAKCLTGGNWNIVVCSSKLKDLSWKSIQCSARAVEPEKKRCDLPLYFEIFDILTVQVGIFYNYIDPSTLLCLFLQIILLRT